jgi:hypothetical protein
MHTTSAVSRLGWARTRRRVDATEPADHGTELALDMVCERGLAYAVAPASTTPSPRKGWWRRMLPGASAATASA